MDKKRNFKSVNVNSRDLNYNSGIVGSNINITINKLFFTLDTKFEQLIPVKFNFKNELQKLEVKGKKWKNFY